MRVKILKDTTLTVKAGQVVEIDGRELPFLTGRVEVIADPEPVKETAPAKDKKKTAKKPAK
jgi:hypothetical protein